MKLKSTLAFALLLLQAGLSVAVATYSNGIISIPAIDVYQLQGLYTDISNDSVFYYNNLTRTGVLAANLNIEGAGALFISNETLLVNSSYDGQYFISVNGGFLSITESSNISAYNPLYRYYVLINGGSITMLNSYLSFAGNESGGNGNHSGFWIRTPLDYEVANIVGNVFSNNYVGFFAYAAYNLNFLNNTIRSSNSTGVYLEYTTSSTNSISGNTISGSPTGIYLNNSNFNLFSSNTVSAGAYGIRLNFSNSNTLSGNNISAPIGIYLDHSHLNSISSSNISASNYGAYLNFSNSTTLSSSTISAPSSLYLGFSDSGTFSFNNLSSTQYGLYSHFSSSNFFISSNISSPTYGVFMNASGARFEGANITRNISLSASSATLIGSYFDFLKLDGFSNITRVWHPPIYISNATANLSGANFSAKDSFGNVRSVLSTSGGRVFLNITQYFQNSTDRLNYTPHNLTIFRGAVRFSSPYSFENESPATFFLIPPDIYWANIPLAITGGNLTIFANVSDPLNISSVLVGIRKSSSVEHNFSMVLAGGTPLNGSYGYNFSNSSIGAYSVVIYANNSQDSRGSYPAGSFEVRALNFSFFNLSDSFGQYDNILNVNESYLPSVKIQEFNGSSYFPVSDGVFNITINGTQYPLVHFNNSIWRTNVSFNASASVNTSSFSANVSGVSANNISGFSNANYFYSTRSSSVSFNLSASLANQNSPVNISGRVSYSNGSLTFNSSNVNVSFWFGSSFAGSTISDVNGSYNLTLTLPASAGIHQLFINTTDTFGVVASNSTFLQARLLVVNISVSGIPSGTSFVTSRTMANISAFVYKSPLGSITSVIAVVSESNYTSVVPLSNATRSDESGLWSGLFNLSSLEYIGSYNVTVYANESTNLTQQVPPSYSSFRVQSVSLSVSLMPSSTDPSSLVRIYGTAVLNPDLTDIPNRTLYFYSNGAPLIINENEQLVWQNSIWNSGVFENSTVFNGTVVMNNTQSLFRGNFSSLSSSLNITVQSGARLFRAGDVVSSFLVSNRTGSLSWGNSSLWFAVNSTKKISRFSPNGTLISNFSLNASITPTGIAYVNGQVFISDALALQLYNFSANGSLNSNSSIPNGSGVSLSFNGSTFWTSAYGRWLFNLELNGSYLSNISTNASNITGIASDGGYLYYIDSNNSRISRIYANGSLVSNFSAPNANRTSYGLAWDGAYLWVANNFTGLAYAARAENSFFGNLTSQPITYGHPVVWGSFSVSDYVPNGTNVSYLLLDASTGSLLCDLSNSTSLADCANSTSVVLFANLTSDSPDYSPVLYNFSISWAANFTSAAYFSNATSTEYPIIFVSPMINRTLYPASSVSINFSIDNGTTWYPANTTYNWTANFSNRNFLYRAFFNTSNQSVSASLDLVSFEYRTAPHTDITGSFNYTFTAPQSYGDYLITANLTDSNGIYGENYASLSLPTPPQVFVVGSSTPVMAQKEETLSTLKIYPNTPILIPVTMEGAAITGFLVSVNKLATNVLISVKKIGVLPEQVQAPVGSIYRILEFSKANLDDENIQTMVVRFKVEKHWLSSNDLNRSSVALLRYSGGRWIALKTSLYKIDDNYTYHETELPGFSFFAIKAEKNIPPAPPPPPSPPPPPEQPAPPPLLRQRDIDIGLERFYALNDTAGSADARSILYQAFEKLLLSQKAFSSGNLTLAKDLLSQAYLLMGASMELKVAKAETPVWYYLIPLLALLLLAGFSYRNMRIELKPDLREVLDSLHANKQALAAIESEYLGGRIDPDTYRLKRTQITAQIDELKARLNALQQAGTK